MSPTEFNAILDALELSQVAAAKLLLANDRTTRRWAAGDRAIPPGVALLLRLLAVGVVNASDLAAVRNPLDIRGLKIATRLRR